MTENGLARGSEEPRTPTGVMPTPHRRLLPFCLGGLTLPGAALRDEFGLRAPVGLLGGWTFGRLEGLESDLTGDRSPPAPWPSGALG
jgi:hypothetical protein